MSIFTLNAQTTKTIKAGAFIVDMGQVPQTVGNGLKPYGLIYDLLKNYQVPILWSIKDGKLKDGTDFTIGANNYKGGPFIIEADFRTDSVNARIVYWQSQGVVGITTTSPVTVPVGTTLIKAPNWTLDKKNGLVAIPYFTNAGIPSSAYGGSDAASWKDPSELSTCDDVFIMPHADPVWSTHSNLLDWNLNSKGGIWLGCSAGSHLEDMFNPSDFTKQTNFLSEKIALASGLGPYSENALKLVESHENGIPPYTYDPGLQSDPIMQFMDILDNAVLNGVERIYIPLAAGWRTSTKVGIYQSNNTEKVDNATNHRAAIIAWGNGFGDVNRGKVFIEASHQFNTSSSYSSGGTKGHNVEDEFRIVSFDSKEGDAPTPPPVTGVAQIAAQRVFFNFSFTAAVGKDVVPTITGLPNNAQVLYSGQSLPLSVTVPTGSNINSYTVKWTSSIGGTFSPSSTSASTRFIAPAQTGTCQLSVTITDGCKRVYFDSKPVDIQCQMEITAGVSDPCNAAPNAGSIALNVKNGAGPFVWKYLKTGAADSVSGKGASISGLSAGDYGVTVIGSNGVGCIAKFNTTLTLLNAFSVAKNSSTNASAYGVSDAAASITVTGSNPVYTYKWNNNATTQNLSSVPAGNYSVTVTDSKGCTAKLDNDIVLTQPLAITAIPTLTHVNCYGANTGAINLTVTGGTSPYTFAWDDGITTQNRTSLNAGTYSITVTDAGGAKKYFGFVISQPTAALSISETHVNLLCSNIATGSVSLTLTGGTTAYTYAWTKTGDDTYSATSKNLTNLDYGSYNITVTDGKSCTATKSISITKPNAITISSVNGNLTCNASNDGSATISISGGTGAYTYAWVGPSSFTASTKNITSLAAGTYTLTTTDANSCTSNFTATITQPAAITVTPTITNVNCFGQNTGAATIVVTGGTASYTYAWNDGSVLSTRTNIAAGNYTLTVTDANSCTKITSVPITQPAAAISISESHVNLLCSNSAAVGTISLTVTGGTTAYTYAWTKTGVGVFSATTQNLSSLDSGTYNVTVTDAKSCQVTKAIKITKPIVITISSSNSNLTCNASNDGSATISISGGTGAYTYAWVGPSSFTASTKNITSLAAGTYTLTTTDANSCTSNFTATITQPAAITVTPTITNVNCFGQNTGAATIVVTGGTASYTYAWNDGSVLSTRTNIAAGNYTLTVTDANSCTKITSVPITQPAAAISISESHVNLLCSNSAAVGTISLTVTGGTTAYTYAWTKTGGGVFSATTQNLNSLDIGNYNVNVTDANACTESKAIEITKPSLLSITTSISQPTCSPLLDGSISLTVSGGTSGYTYNWGGGIVTQNRTTVGPGSYSVTVTDAHGCTNTVSPVLAYQNPSPVTPSNISH